MYSGSNKKKIWLTALRFYDASCSIQDETQYQSWETARTALPQSTLYSKLMSSFQLVKSNVELSTYIQTLVSMHRLRPELWVCSLSVIQRKIGAGHLPVCQQSQFFVSFISCLLWNSYQEAAHSVLLGYLTTAFVSTPFHSNILLSKGTKACGMLNNNVLQFQTCKRHASTDCCALWKAGIRAMLLSLRTRVKVKNSSLAWERALPLYCALTSFVHDSASQISRASLRRIDRIHLGTRCSMTLEHWDRAAQISYHERRAALTTIVASVMPFAHSIHSITELQKIVYSWYSHKEGSAVRKHRLKNVVRRLLSCGFKVIQECFTNSFELAQQARILNHRSKHFEKLRTPHATVFRRQNVLLRKLSHRFGTQIAQHDSWFCQFYRKHIPYGCYLRKNILCELQKLVAADPSFSEREHFVAVVDTSALFHWKSMSARRDGSFVLWSPAFEVSGDIGSAWKVALIKNDSPLNRQKIAPAAFLVPFRCAQEAMALMSPMAMKYRSRSHSNQPLYRSYINPTENKIPQNGRFGKVLPSVNTRSKMRRVWNGWLERGSADALSSHPSFFISSFWQDCAVRIGLISHLQAMYAPQPDVRDPKRGKNSHLEYASIHHYLFNRKDNDARVLCFALSLQISLIPCILDHDKRNESTQGSMTRVAILTCDETMKRDACALGIPVLVPYNTSGTGK